MILLALAIAGEIRSARKALARRPAGDHAAEARAAQAGDTAAALQLALRHAEDCLADLERAEALLESERASAERARAALDRAMIAAEIEAAQRAQIAAAAAAPDSPAEAKRRRAANLRRLAAMKKGGLL